MIEVMLIGHVMVEIWRSRDDDLVNARQALRAPFMAVIGVTCLILTGFKFANLLGFPHYRLVQVQAAVTALTALAVASAFMQERARLFEQPFFKKLRGDGSSAQAGVADEASMQRLSQLMDDEAFWRQPGLTIGATAEKVGVPEYRLRQMINRNLGYRNFSDFLNERRVTVAKQELKTRKNCAFRFRPLHSILATHHSALLTRRSVKRRACHRANGAAVSLISKIPYRICFLRVFVPKAGTAALFDFPITISVSEASKLKKLSLFGMDEGNSAKGSFENRF